MRRLSPWTDEETELARLHYKRGVSPEEFLAKTGRTKDAAKRRFEYVDRPEVRERHIKKQQMYRDAAKASGDMHTAARKVAVPPDVLQDAKRRASAPRSLTGVLMGDPPVPAAPNNTSVLA